MKNTNKLFFAAAPLNFRRFGRRKIVAMAGYAL